MKKARIFGFKEKVPKCVLIVEDSNKPNIITTETELRRYGRLIGSPVLGSC